MDRRSGRMSGFQRLATSSAVAALALTAVGGAVRATDSGLACPTWPGCFTAGDFVPPADLHVWLEHSHRLLAGVVGLLIAALALWALLRHRQRRDLLWPTLAAAVLVNVQALLGAFVVWRLLRAELVTAHLGLAMVIVACLVVVAVNAGAPRRDGLLRAALAPGLPRRSAAVAGLALAQVLIGGHVSGIGAGLVYRLDGFPLMDGVLFPAITAATERELFHASHRWLGVALLVATAWLWRLARRQRLGDAATAPLDRWLARLPAIATGLVALQIAIGVANIWSELSWVSVIPHLAVATWIWTALFLQALLAARAAAAPAPPSPETAQARPEVVA